MTSGAPLDDWHRMVGEFFGLQKGRPLKIQNQRATLAHVCGTAVADFLSISTVQRWTHRELS